MEYYSKCIVTDGDIHVKEKFYRMINFTKNSVDESVRFASPVGKRSDHRGHFGSRTVAVPVHSPGVAAEIQ
jgi:hypothetical protein